MSKIEWTEETWNPVTGCTRVSAGCDNCYAVSMTRRLEAMGQERYAGLVNEGKRHFNGVVRCHEDVLRKPFSWRKPRVVFVNSMADLFHRDVPRSFIVKVLAVIALTPRHTYQVLTKRPEIAAEIMASITTDELIEAAYQMFGEDAQVWLANYLNGWSMPIEDGNPCNGTVPRWPLPNLWLGTSVEDQRSADERVLHLTRCPAAVRFISVEPLLGAVYWNFFQKRRDEVCVACGDGTQTPCDNAPGQCPHKNIHWVIAGGESGAGARPCDVEWIRSLKRQCEAAGVPIFIKQLGARPMLRRHAFDDSNNPLEPKPYYVTGKGNDMSEWPADLRVRQMPGREQ